MLCGANGNEAIVQVFFSFPQQPIRFLGDEFLGLLAMMAFASLQGYFDGSQYPTSCTQPGNPKSAALLLALFDSPRAFSVR
jgi:hypothetical protein